MFHPVSMFSRQELTTTSSNNRTSASEDSPDFNLDFSRKREGPVIKLLRQTSSSNTNKTLTKLLVHVNVEGSFGPVHVILSAESRVGDLIQATIEVYLKEKRRPLLAYMDARCFDLHYSQFNLQRLNQEEKLINLESRNFFLCPKPNNISSSSSSSSTTTTTTFPAANNSLSFSEEPKTTTSTTVAAGIHVQNLPFPCTKFMDFLL